MLCICYVPSTSSGSSLYSVTSVYGNSTSTVASNMIMLAQTKIIFFSAKNTVIFPLRSLLLSPMGVPNSEVQLYSKCYVQSTGSGLSLFVFKHCLAFYVLNDLCFYAIHENARQSNVTGMSL